ncbi:fructosamine kinase family protein [Alteromonas oceanisediminis]|uniref:fructosamine kinase family protein n=1 Tax=Alteromonas oceanisediminis TaxID=2836180 RepID=UPI001BDA0A56|nr:fructosamine kinase family protein [Alteromonas oceanisediminis]MBT0587279.1 fructosamine kinase family protein [Alteromonas oceanisediminis]
MWHFISDHVSQAKHREFICDSVKPLHQQHECASYQIRSGDQRYFAKIRTGTHQKSERDTAQLHAEADSLNALRCSDSFKVPEVICVGWCDEETVSYEYLILEFVGFKPPSNALWKHAGEALATLHKHPPKGTTDYGWPTDNWVGSTPQFNKTNAHWRDFYFNQRLKPLLDALHAQDKLRELSLEDAFELTHVLHSHQPTPCLLHGDLWRGNLGFTRSHVVVFDPAVYVGDREIDLAMARLFQGFASSFFEAYAATWPLNEGVERRLPLYQLYPMLNHLLLFGDTYRAQVLALLEECRAH